MSDTLDSLSVSFQEALAGRYSLDRELGRGGMGVVYLAREVRLDRPVAIKLLPPLLAAQRPLRDRFLREARTAARLSHPNIVPIFSVDEVGDFVFYVMAYIDGNTLASRIATRGALRPAQVARILREVAWALAYAHAQGVVHRDVKPENILLEAGTGRALLADFGIAHLAQASGGTAVGEVLGTPEFMSPEQAAGERVDGRSDLYALGVVGYYALSGKLPFEGPSAQAILAQHLTQPAPPIAAAASGAPPAMAAAIDRCLAKDPAQRFQSGEALAEALGDTLGPNAETPAAVRVFLKYGAGAGAGAVLWYLLVGTLTLDNFLSMLRPPIWPLTLALQGLLLAAVFGAPPALLLYQARRLLGHGYGHDDVVLALRREAERRLEEASLALAERPTIGRRILRGLGMGLVGVGAVWLAGTVIAIPVGEFAYLNVGAMLVGAVAGLVGPSRHRPIRGGRVLSGSIGKWLFRLAGIGHPAPLTAPGAARPTEVVIGQAAAALFEALDKETRRALGDLPDVVQRLERHAREVRARLADIERTITETRIASPTLQATRRASLVADLEAAREAVQRRLGQVAEALESIRLGLLRLRVGEGTVEGVTEDLTEARAIGEQTVRLLQAEEEAEAVLRSPSPPPGHASGA